MAKPAGLPQQLDDDARRAIRDAKTALDVHQSLMAELAEVQKELERRAALGKNSKDTRRWIPRL